MKSADRLNVIKFHADRLRDTTQSHVNEAACALSTIGEMLFIHAIEDKEKGRIREVEAGVRVDRLGNSSVQYGIAIFKAGEQEAAAHGHFVHVFVQRAENRSAPIPQNLRAALERLSGP